MSQTSAQKILVAIGSLLIAATWLYLVLFRPTDWESVGGPQKHSLLLVDMLGHSPCSQEFCPLSQHVPSRLSLSH